MNPIERWRWKRLLVDVDYSKAADILTNQFAGAVIPNDLARLLDVFTSDSCFDTAVLLLKFDPRFLAVFQLTAHGTFTHHLMEDLQNKEIEP